MLSIPMDYKEAKDIELKQEIREEWRPGDPISDVEDMAEALQESGVRFSRKNLYCDAVGFLEHWQVQNCSIIVDAMDGNPTVRCNFYGDHLS
jgi:hypothetical protein